MYDIKLLNKISDAGLSRFSRRDYRIGTDEVKDPDAILVRSANMHEMELPASLKAIARAGAGTNNIPIEECSKRGIVVFNTPGANANAVKELVILALLLASRKVVDGIEWAKTLAGKGDEIPDLAEKGKSTFVGPELYGKKLGVVGLGAIGVQVANTAIALGMDVYGYDPYLSLDAAWGLDKNVHHADSLKTLYTQCDYLTLHVPSTNETRGMLNADVFPFMKRGMRIINLARAELVNHDDLEAAIEAGYVARYVCDFATEQTLAMKKTVVMPHLGASTPESEDNCAAMAAKELIYYLEQGRIKNSVNFPTINNPRTCKVRVCLLHKNVKNMIGQITAVLSRYEVNIEHLYNSSKKEYAATLIDTDDDVSAAALEELSTIPDIITVRKI
ncbi:MAG: phosphoglycerate dehydrogenase [Eubacteriales bacterium]|jgi:D-3-phosphoglycerate dehydrogenase